MRSLHAVIVGGGIGGLATALALRHSGLDVTVLEQADEFREVGAGLQVSPNSTKVLEYLGLGDQLAQTGVRPDRLESRHWQTGELLGEHELNGAHPRYGAPHYVMYRVDILDALLTALPKDVLHLGSRCVGVHQDRNGVRVDLANGSSVTGDLVIGADGIHSVLRESLLGTVAPTFSGTVAYRGLVPAERVAHLRLANTSTKWWGPTPEHHLVHYYVAAGKLVNFIAVVPETDWVQESWTAKGDVTDLRAQFDSYHSPIPELVASVDEVFKWALHDRPPLPNWSRGRLTLLGDACHPMVPFLAQGSAMAIEDAAVLARCLEGRPADDIPAALVRYEHIRRERTERIQRAARSDTHESWRARDWIYGYDALTTPLP